MSDINPTTSIMNEMVQAAISSGKSKVTCYGDKPAAERGVFRLIKKTFAVAMLTAVTALACNVMSQNAEVIRHAPLLIQAEQQELDLPQDADQIGAYDEYTNSSTLSEKMFDNGKLFMSLATLIENVKTEVYYDSGGANIGMGYCIDRQLKDQGVDAVLKDFKAAKIDDDQAKLLVGTKRERQSAHITVTQAVNLLDITTDRYQNAAKKWLGEDHFDRLTPMQQTAITYLTYNVGASNISGFKRLKTAIIEGQDSKIVRNLTPMFKTVDGEWKKNERVGNALAATWQSGASEKPKPI